MCIYIAKLTHQFPNSCWKIIIREAKYSNRDGPSYSMRGPSDECCIFAHRSRDNAGTSFWLLRDKYPIN